MFPNQELLKEKQNDLFVGSIETSDLMSRYCECSGDILTISIFLKRPNRVRSSIFHSISDIEAYERGLIGSESKSFCCNDFPIKNIIFRVVCNDDPNKTRVANFIHSGLQTRFSITVNQGAMIEARKKLHTIKRVRLWSISE